MRLLIVGALAALAGVVLGWRAGRAHPPAPVFDPELPVPEWVHRLDVIAPWEQLPLPQ